MTKAISITTAFTTLVTISLMLVSAAFAGHNGAVVSVDEQVCSATTISAEIADPSGTHKVSNMYLVVDDGNNVQYKVIPTDGTSADITVGPFSENTTVSWNVFGGGERSYDQPLWNGFGGATFSSDVSAYAASQGGSYSWVIAGVDDPNPFVNWNEVEISKCIVRDAEIISPTAGSTVFGAVDFEAKLTDDDPDNVQWAVRKGTCSAGTNTVFGNVDGKSDVATIEQTDVENQTFSFTGDMSSMEAGMYCFIYNPVEDGGESNIRETVEFNLVEIASSKNQCMKGGWSDLVDHEGNTFTNQGDCVSYVATGGKNLGAGAKIN